VCGQLYNHHVKTRQASEENCKATTETVKMQDVWKMVLRILYSGL